MGLVPDLAFLPPPEQIFFLIGRRSAHGGTGEGDLPELPLRECLFVRKKQWRQMLLATTLAFKKGWHNDGGLLSSAPRTNAIDDARRLPVQGLSLKRVIHPTHADLRKTDETEN